MRKFMSFVIMAIGIALATGCDEAADVTDVPEVDVTQVPPLTAEAEPEQSQVEVNPASGGLGLTTEEWQAVHGRPVETEFGDAITRYPGDGGFHVDIPGYTDPNQITLMDIDFRPPVELEAAEAATGDYLPADAERLETYTDELADQHVVLYHSDWLAGAVNPEGEYSMWFGAEPGAFFASYGWQSTDPSTGRIAYVLVGLGHSP